MKLEQSVRSVALCAALTLLAACGSKADRVQSGLSKGADYVQLADWDKASVEARNVLQIDPKNARAYFISGQVAEAKRDIQRAFNSYLKAVELDGSLADAKVGLARVYLLAGEVGKAEKAIAEVLSAEPANLGGRTMKAVLLARRDDVPGAIALAKGLIAEQKTPPVDASLVLAGLYTGQRDTAAALATIEAALKANPKSLTLLQVAAQITGDATDAAVQAKAVDYFKRLTAHAPKNTEFWNAWALHHVRRNEIDQAEAVLRASVLAQPDDSSRTLSLLDLLASRRSHDAAEKAFIAAIAAKPKDAALRFGLVNLYRADNRSADVRRVLQEIVDTSKDAAPGLAARNQLAADRLANGKVAEARDLIAQVLKANPRDGSALVMHGRMLLADGDARGAIIDLRSAAKDQPGSPEVTGLLARAHRQAGEPQLAREALIDAVKFKPDSAELRMLLAADMADSKEYKTAAAEVDAVIRLAPKNLLAHDMKAKLALAQGDTASAERTYVALKAQFPSDPVAFLKLGQFYGEQKKFDAALKEYEAAMRLAPTAPEPLLSTIGILLVQRKFDDANARIDALMQREPKNVLPYQLRGDVALARNDLPAAEKAYREMVAFAPTVPVGYLQVATVKARQDKMADAIAVVEGAEKAIPGAISLPAARADLLSRAGRQDDAIALYEVLVKRAPDDDAYANNLAYLLTESKGGKTSLDRALALTLRFKESGNPSYLDTLGWVHYQRGEYEASVAVLERAVRQSPEVPLLQLHLGMALYKQGDTPRGIEILKKALASKATLPHADEARILVAQR